MVARDRRSLATTAPERAEAAPESDTDATVFHGSVGEVLGDRVVARGARMRDGEEDELRREGGRKEDAIVLASQVSEESRCTGSWSSTMEALVCAA